MKQRIWLILVLLAFVTATPYAQQRSKVRTTTQKTQKSNRTNKSNGTNRTKKNKKAAASATPTVQSLQNQRQQIQKQIKEQERRLASSQQDVKKRLQTLMVINNEIAGKRRTIDTIRHDIVTLDDNIEHLGIQLDELQAQLAECKQRYVKSMRYMHRNRSAQSQMMFIFSADNLTQMVRRLRFMREYAAYQHVQGDEVKTQQEAVNSKFQELNRAKSQKTVLLAKGERERIALEDKQAEQQNVVKTLQKEQKTIQGIIAQQKKKDAALNAQIDRLIAEEIARQKARAAAEAKRKAEASARERRLAEARAREEAAKAKALAAKSNISGNFESNRGRLPMPITGPYRVVSHFGQYNVEGLHGVTLDNKGINIRGEQGAQARSIFDGEVSAVFSFGGTMVVMVRHGSYISVYCNLSSVSVHRGQKVSTRQILGRVAGDNILQFQLRRETAKLNPESWLGR